MKLQLLRRPLVAASMLAVGIVILAIRNGRAQDDVLEDVLIEADQAQGPKERRMDIIKRRPMLGRPKTVVALAGGPDRTHELREAARAVNEAEDDDARDQAQERLEQILVDRFTEDMKRREQELADIEKRIQKLRALLDRRREKKREIVDLHMQVLLNEADGLGFFSGEAFDGVRVPGEMHIEAYPGAGITTHAEMILAPQPAQPAQPPARVPPPPAVVPR
jgi:hypothetical protein